MLFKRKKVAEPVWELQTELDKQKAILEGMEDVTWETYERQLKIVMALEKQKRDWEASIKPPEKRKVSGDTWVAAGVTTACASAPYLIEKAGKIAPHLKGKVPLPKIWK